MVYCNVLFFRSLFFDSLTTCSTVPDTSNQSAERFSDVQAPLRGTLEMILEVVESQLELDLGIRVGPVFAVALL